MSTTLKALLHETVMRLCPENDPAPHNAREFAEAVAEIVIDTLMAANVFRPFHTVVVAKCGCEGTPHADLKDCPRVVYVAVPK